MGSKRTECPDAELLGRYVEATLAGGEREELESHLAECRRCRLAVSSALDAGGAVRRLGPGAVWYALGAAAAVMILTKEAAG